MYQLKRLVRCSGVVTLAIVFSVVVIAFIVMAGYGFASTVQHDQKTLLAPTSVHNETFFKLSGIEHVRSITTGESNFHKIAITVAAQNIDAEKIASAQPKKPDALASKKPIPSNQTASESPSDDGLHDKQNDAITVLQSPIDAMKDFPRDRRMEVDWVKTLEQGHIEPRANLTGEEEMVTMDLDIVMKNTQFMPWVKFPHFAHTKWLACSNCHPGIFLPQVDANPITMNKVLRGEYCGVCHDKVAFSLYICERCHSVPHEGSGPKWW